MWTVPLPFANEKVVRGQVPTRENIEANKFLADAEKMPSGITVARLLAHDMPMLSTGSIVKGLGFDVAKSSHWENFLEHTMSSSPNEIVMRKAVMEKCISDRLGPELRMALLQRSLMHWRAVRRSLIEIRTPLALQKRTQDNFRKPALRKSEAELPKAPGRGAQDVVQVVKVERHGLRKGETKGGKYYRRVPNVGGMGHTYYYTKEDYDERPDAHVSGEDALRTHISGKVLAMAEAAGEGGFGLDSLADLVGKHGSKAIAELLQDGCGGKLEWDGERFRVCKSVQPKLIVRG